MANFSFVGCAVDCQSDWMDIASGTLTGLTRCSNYVLSGLNFIRISAYSTKMSLTKLFTSLTLSKQLLTSPSILATAQIRAFKFVVKPEPGKSKKQFRRIVHFPEDGKYTVQPLDNTHLAGRDPVSGRKVAQGIGGGVKHK